MEVPPTPPTGTSPVAAAPAPSDAVAVAAHTHVVVVEENKSAALAVTSAAAAATRDDTVVAEADTTHDSEKCTHKKWPFKVQPVKYGKGGLGECQCSIMTIS